MPRTMVEVIHDDFTGEKHQPHEVEDVVLKFGYREWRLVLTPDSKSAIQGLLDPFTKDLPCKDSTPAWVKAPASATDQAGTGQPPAVTVVPPDNTTVRRWWADLTPADLRTLKLDAPKSNRGKIPESVMEAFVETHKAPAAPAVPPAAFSGQ